ncbi:MAG TPA: phosphatidate cytidylyltransferase [Actinomycetales bacterium]|nr:phosphatidate cytidylyltransferase [Actinomycetales bacterium]
MSEPVGPRAAAPASRRAVRTAARKPGRAGRNLPAAIAVGAVLGALVLASLLVRKEAFVVVVAAAVCLALWELTQALGQRGIAVPLVPVAVGAVAMLVAAFTAGGQALAVCFLLTAVGVVVWRTAEGPVDGLRDVAGGIFAAAYLPLLAGFAMLMLAEPDGALRVLTFVLVTIASDIGGYAAGVLTGRHPMAPSVSPKKSWEGFAGSAVTCVVVGVLAVVWLLDGPWWAGALVGASAVLTATLGDLGESMIKRDLGIKDMGSVLPGHGGLMDRLDSLVMTAPVCWVLLHMLVR